MRCVAAAFLGLLGIPHSTHGLCAAEEAIELVDARLVPLRSVGAGECSGKGKRRAAVMGGGVAPASQGLE